MKYIASVSFGKDSLAMVIMLIQKNYPLDWIIFYDTGMEFKAIYRMKRKFQIWLFFVNILRILQGNNWIRFKTLQPHKPFLWTMFEKPVNGKNGAHNGYSWCGGMCRWGTTEKLKALEQFCKGSIEYVGLAADEPKRLEKERKGNKIFPLSGWGITEAECLQFCYQHGYTWKECGIRLYDILDRVSCWCCSNKNLKELRNYYHYLPQYWQKLKALQCRTARPFKGKGKSVFELENRFQQEERQHNE